MDTGRTDRDALSGMVVGKQREIEGQGNGNHVPARLNIVQRDVNRDPSTLRLILGKFVH